YTTCHNKTPTYAPPPHTHGPGCSQAPVYFQPVHLSQVVSGFCESFSLGDIVVSGGRRQSLATHTHGVNTHTHTHTHTLTHSLTDIVHTHTHTHSPHTCPLSLTHTLTHIHTPTDTHTHTHT